MGVRLVGRAVGVSGSSVLTADGAAVSASAIVWATGYRSEYPWLCAPVFGPGKTVVHERGVTRAPGLHFLGLSWQHTRGSALLGWVGGTRSTWGYGSRRSATRPASSGP